MYSGRWHHALSKWDVITDLALANPEYLNSFYGLGNSAVIDKNLKSNDFYIANFNQYNLYFGIAQSFWKRSEFSIKTGLGIFNSSPLEGTILSDNDIDGAKGTITTIPTIAEIDVDLRDHSMLPYRGVRTVLSASNYSKLNGEKNNYGSLNGSLEYYLSNYTKNRITLGFKLAGSKGYGAIPYYHQASLGGGSGLRGYTGSRFTGRSMIYFNSEVRMEILSNEHASIPWILGLLGFYDTGRVFIENNPEDDALGFRSGYGVGLFIIPFSRSFSMTLTLGWSEEESVYPGFTIGTSLK